MPIYLLEKGIKFLSVQKELEKKLSMLLKNNQFRDPPSPLKNPISLASNFASLFSEKKYSWKILFHGEYG